MTAWEGDEYQQRFDALAERGADVHGEADLLVGFEPGRVLDAGCGTGRVAIELHRRGIDVVGVDPDASMIETARRLAPELRFVHQGMQDFDSDERFDVVVMAGNVMLFADAADRCGVVAGCARHLRDDGVVVAGFQLGRGVEVADYDRCCNEAGLTLDQRWSTWDREPFDESSGYAVSVHRR